MTEKPAAATLDLEEIAELLISSEKRKELRTWVEDQAAEWMPKPWLVKPAVRALDMLVNKLLARVKKLAAAEVREQLEQWRSETGLRGKLTRQILNLAGLFLEKKGQGVRKLLDELDAVLNRGEKPSSKEAALAARQMAAMEEVRAALGDRLEQVLDILEYLEPELPLKPWDEKWSPNDPVSRLILHTPLIGRQNEMQRLKGFLEKDRQPIFILSGPGGQGKTKLGLELCRWADQQGWAAWFLLQTPSFDQWGKLQRRLGERRGLVVVDYALTHGN